jgi:hypothetical protein
VTFSIPWTVLKWYLTQKRCLSAFIHKYVWLLYPFMFRNVRGVPRSDIRIVSWCDVSGDSVQKSRRASLDRSPVSGIHFL